MRTSSYHLYLVIPGPTAVLKDDLGPKRARVTYTIHGWIRKYFDDGGSVILQNARPGVSFQLKMKSNPCSCARTTGVTSFLTRRASYKILQSLAKLLAAF